MAALTEDRVRAIVYRTRGSKHGPITRLVSPGDLGELIKPFVFLDLFDFTPTADRQTFGIHPHSGIATVTVMLEGRLEYEDTTGAKGILSTGGVEWMSAGNGVWHDGVALDRVPVRGFQLWVALPAADENAPARSIYCAAAQIPQDGPARVVLGSCGDARSAIPSPASMTYLSVELQDGEQWRYVPPPEHDVAWVAVESGRLDAGEPVDAGELAVFDDSGASIEFVAQGRTRFVLGSAARHPHELVLGRYSVHTSRQSLERGEEEIARIGRRLRLEGRL